MFEFHAHGVGSVTLSGGFAEPLFDPDLLTPSPAGGTVTVSRQVSRLESGAVFGSGLPDNRFVLHGTFHLYLPLLVSTKTGKVYSQGPSLSSPKIGT